MHVYEFLFRGGPTSKPDDDTWHVVLANERVDMLGRSTIEISDALTPARAAELGFTLDKILSALDARAVEAVAIMQTERDNQRQKANDAYAETSLARKQIRDLAGEIQEREAALDAAKKTERALSGEIKELRNQLQAARAAKKETKNSRQRDA